MNLRKLLQSIFTALVLTQLAWTGSLKSIQSEVSNIKSLKSRFVQKKYLLNILKKPLVSKGNFYFKNDKHKYLRLEYKHPVQIKNILLMKDSSVKQYIWNNGKYQKSQSSNTEVIRIVFEEIQMWLSGNLDTDNFSARLSKSQRRAAVLVPKKPQIKNMIKKIVITFSSRRGIIKEIKIVENKNSFTTLSFLNVKLNSKINDSIFNTVN